MAYFDGDFDEFLEDRLKRCKTARFGNLGARPQPKTGKNRSTRFNRKLVWLAVSYLVVIGFLFGSFGTAYAAKDSLPNEPLYAVKLAGEDLQLLLTTDTNARISLLTTFANRRADEVTILASQGEPVPEQVSALIDEYQQEIVVLSVDLENKQDPPVDGNFRRPQDQDVRCEDGEDNCEDPECEDGDCPVPECDDNDEDCDNTNRVRVSQPTDDQTPAIIDLENSDPAISDTSTIGNSGTSNMSQSRSGSSNGSGQENRQEYNPGPDYEYDPSEVVPSLNNGPGPNFGLESSSTVPHQLPAANPLMENGSFNQPTENKGNKPQK